GGAAHRRLERRHPQHPRARAERGPSARRGGPGARARHHHRRGLMLADWPLDEARAYQPDLSVPADLADLWHRTLDDAPVTWDAERVDHGLLAVETHDVTFAGFGGQPIRAWLHLPASPLRTGALPGVVHLQGYNGGRGLAHEHVFWATAGYAQLVVD